MKINHKKIFNILTVCVCLAIIAAALWFYVPFRTVEKKVHPEKPREPWIVVFIHGNFNTGLGLFSIKPVFRDSIKGSTYSRVTRQMRKDPFFFQEQPILHRGLVSVTPSFNHPIGEFKYAVYPIMSAYREISEIIAPNKEELHFYTFGWSGLMSQTHRLKEALRLYNAVSEEIQKFRALGLQPKVRIIAHSHGGNVSLNVASINEALALERKHNDPFDYIAHEKSLGVHERQTLQKALTFLKELPKEKNPLFEQSQKRYDYYPSKETLTVDELIVLGTPIQPETSHLIRSCTFKNIYNFYSEGDIVQIMDFISSKKCQQRFDPDVVHEGAPHLVEAKVMVERNLQKDVSRYESHPWWRKVMIDSWFAGESKDPTHKDLWFLAWNKDFTQPNFPLSPLPVVAIVPILMAAVNRAPHLRDVDLNLRWNNKKFIVDVFKHNAQRMETSQTFNNVIIEEIKKKVEAWRPDTISRANVFQKIHSLVKQ